MTQAARVTVSEVKDLMRRGAPFAFVDARAPHAWNEAQVKLPGAIRVAAGEARKRLGEIPQDVTVITYCTCPDEASSDLVAQELSSLGLKNVHPLYGGFHAWVEADLPLEPKECETKDFEITT
jgi:rhodanese-related sulfurtransferase